MKPLILIIKLGALGDVLRTTAIIKFLFKKNFELNILTSPIGNLIYKNNPYIKKTYIIKHKKNILSLFLLQKQLQKNNYEYIINFENLNTIKKLTKKLNHKTYIDYENIDNSLSNSLNVNKYFFEFIKPISKDEPESYKNELFPTTKEKEKIDLFLKSLNIKTKIICLHTGSSKTNRLFNKNFKDCRLWSLENYIDLIKKLLNKNYFIFLTGSIQEKSINQKIKQEINNSNILDVYFNIQELYYFFSKINWFISSDTGTAHIAAGTNVKQICLCGPTDAKISAPLKNNDFYILQKNDSDCLPCYAYDIDRRNKCNFSKCMDNIKVNDILNIIN